MEVISDRITCRKTEEETSIVISSVANRKAARTPGLILLFWIVGGIVLMTGFPGIEDSNARVFVLVWLGFWLYFLYVLFRLWRWKKYGHEILKIRDGKFFYKKDVKGRGWVFSYPLKDIRSMGPNENRSPAWLVNFGGEFWNTDCDSFSFHENDKEVNFGYQLSDKEKQRLLEIFGPWVDIVKKESNRSKKKQDRKAD